MSKMKELYLAKSLEELNNQVTKSLDSATPRGLCRLAEKLILRAKDEELAGDEEQAYVLYMRFVDVVKAVRGSKEFKKDKKYFNDLLPTRRISDALDSAERLSASLKKRYEELSKKGLDNEPISKQKIVPVETQKVTTPTPITPTELYTLLISKGSCVLVVDCRPRASYVASHTDTKKFPQWVTIPEEVILKELTEKSAESFMSKSGKSLWRGRGDMVAVVMVDEDSPANQLKPLLLTLMKVITMNCDGHKCYVLDGGYCKWYLAYHVTTIGLYKPPQRSEVIITSKESPKMAYPTLEEISEPMNSDLFVGNPSSVSIDMEEFVAMEALPPSQRDAVTTVMPPMQRGMDVFVVPSFPSYVPLPPAPLAPLSLEGESELLAPSLSEDILPIQQEADGFGIVAQEALIDTPLPGGHAPLFNHANYPPLELNRVVSGPIPYPPSYYQSYTLPALAPVQPPIPPPVSLVNQSNQPNQFEDAKDARIKELEERLANTERAAAEKGVAVEEEARELAAERKKLLEEKERQNAEVALARQQFLREQELGRAALEAQRRSVAEERERVAQESMQLNTLKEQFDRERVQMSQEAAARQQLERRRREEQERVFSVGNGPSGWEKRLDATTGRFYYVDHETKTTHWNPPTNWINYQQARQAEADKLHPPSHLSQPPTQVPPTQLLPTQPSQPPTQPSQPPTQPSQSSQPPTQLSQPPSQPSPPSTQTPPGDKSGPVVPDRSKKPVAKQPVIVMTPAMQQQKQQHLQAVFGTGRHILTGLRNLGNTCYMNSTLQCLACTTPVIQYFISGNYQQHINHSNPLGSRGQIVTEFAWLMKALWCGRYKHVTPRDFKDMIGQLVPSMRGNDQQDSQEFLAFLLDGLHEDLNKVKKKVFIAESDGQEADETKAAKLAWDNHIRRNDSIIVKYFQGMFRSSIKCVGCGKSSVTFEPFMYLSLPIPQGQGSYSLEECVKLFIRAETVDWSCPNCKDSRGKAVKKMDIWRLPPVLLIHLKRFSYQGMWKEKRQNTIIYPTNSALDMSQLVASPKGYSSFTLYAVSNHFGTLTGGHYTACSRNPHNRLFYNFDDHDVKEALPRQVQSSAAYILYYSAVNLTPAATPLT